MLGNGKADPARGAGDYGGLSLNGHAHPRFPCILRVPRRAPLASTVIGSSVDTLLFFTISFAAWITIFGAAADADVSWAWQGAPLLLIGPEAPLWVTLMLADWVLKLLIGLLALIPFRLIVTKVSQNMV